MNEWMNVFIGIVRVRVSICVVAGCSSGCLTSGLALVIYNVYINNYRLENILLY